MLRYDTVLKLYYLDFMGLLRHSFLMIKYGNYGCRMRVYSYVIRQCDAI
jgi:hypothetical protein